MDEDNIQGRCSVSILNRGTLFENVQFDRYLRSAGHSVCKLYDDCLMICGCMRLQYFDYSSKQVVPSSCDFDNECKIIEFD